MTALIVNDNDFVEILEVSSTVAYCNDKRHRMIYLVRPLEKKKKPCLDHTDLYVGFHSACCDIFCPQ